MNASLPLHLFEGYGVELEYVLVDRQSLDVMPIADRVLQQLAGRPASEVELGEASWSNELMLHVIELKNTEPAASLETLVALFQDQLQRVDALLATFGARLLPAGMHPWMDPRRESRLWPHAFREVYETYHRIFDCFRHGWANVQSVHLNLPFAGDEEFARLHAAIRVLLPILPALAASSPICEGRVTGLLDTRMDHYRRHTDRVPSLTGQVIPEPVFRQDEYQERILDRLYRDIAPYDPDGTLQHEFLNARGAIARFDRNAIEIRVLDVQECPLANLALCAATAAVLKRLVEERWSDLGRQQAWGVEPLHEILLRCIRDGEQALMPEPTYGKLFGYRGTGPATAGQLWASLIERIQTEDPDFERSWGEPLRRILDSGPLARRILRGIAGSGTPPRLKETYGRLCECVLPGTMLDESARQR